jgi:CRP-like cAMP-binding protein
MVERNTGNLFLDGASDETLDALGGESDDYEISIVLSDADQTPRHVYFPHTGAVASVLRTTEQGTAVETGLIGSEGLISVHSVIAKAAPTRSQTIVQAAGKFTRVTSDAARSHFQTDVTFRDRVLAYTSSFLNQITQHTVCNRLHSIEQRLAKWLLAMRDRVGNDELHMTHEFLAHMLGIHRPGVSIAISALEIDGLIVHSRNRIHIRDGEGMLLRTCECYAVVHDDLVSLRALLTE